MKLTLRNRIIISFAMVLFSIIVFCTVFFYSVLYRSSYADISGSIANQSTQSATLLNMQLQSIDAISLYVRYSPQFLEWLGSKASLIDIDPNLAALKAFIDQDLKQNAFYSNLVSADVIDLISVYYNSSLVRSIYTNATFNMEKQQDNAEYFATLSNSAPNVLASHYKGSMYYSRRFINSANPGEAVTIVITINEQSLCDKYTATGRVDGITACLTSKSGSVLSSSDKSLLGNVLPLEILRYRNADKPFRLTFNGAEYLIVASSLEVLDTSLIVAAPLSAIVKSVTDSIKHYMIFIMLITLSLLAIGIYLSMETTRFVNALVNSMQELEKGNYKARMPDYDDANTGNLSAQFNKTAEKMEHLIEREYKSQLLEKENHIKLLQSQMNPHFLFNILIVIATKAKTAKDETIYKMITSLSKLLRSGLNSGDDIITVAKELEYIGFYLYLQKMRFEDKLNYIIEVDEELKQCLIPRLSIEPIVENAVTHGIESNVGKGEVRVTLSKKHDKLIIKVSDNGKGFDKIAMQQGKGIGVANTHERIQLLYGKDYGILVEANQPEGALVSIILPMITGV